MVIQIKQPPEASHPGQFQEHEPQPARQQKPGQLLLRFAPRRRKERACACEKDEDRRAVVRNPTREKQCRIRLRQIGRIKRQVFREKIARMVQRHDHHYESTQCVNRVESGLCRGLRLWNADVESGGHVPTPITTRRSSAMLYLLYRLKYSGFQTHCFVKRSRLFLRLTLCR